LFLKIVILDIMTQFSVSWRLDSIPNIGTENRLGSYQFVSKILEIDSGFESIPRVEIVRSGRFQKLESKPDPTVSLNISNIILRLLAS